MKKLVADLSLLEVMLKEGIKGNYKSATKGSPCGTIRKNAAQMVMDKYQISERAACGLVGLSRTTWRHLPIPRDDETKMRPKVIRLASTYGRYGYRTIAGLVRQQLKLLVFGKKKGSKFHKSRHEVGYG